MTVHYFFIPYRILWDDWETFITGGPDGDDDTPLPTWSPTPVTGNAQNSLWDYLGFPVGVIPTGALPLDFPRRAYNRVWNEYYRDENLQDEVLETNENILNRCWTKDYFTSALPWQQRGTSPALPIAGITSAVFPSQEAYDGSLTPQYLESSQHFRSGTFVNILNHNTVDLSTASTFDIADLRLAFQIQKWMERNARAGVRYTEFLRAHYNESPRDDRLDRPEYIGGSKSPIIISEVLQTSSTDAVTPQGNLAGHGLIRQS